MAVETFLIIDDGDIYAKTVSFDVRPEVGEVLHWMSDGKHGHARVVRIEHRENPKGFCFTVIAESFDPESEGNAFFAV